MIPIGPPPPGFPLRDSNTGLIWQQDTDGEWTALTPNRQTWVATWDDLAGGKYGTLEMLVPVPYNTRTPEPGTDAARQAVIAGVLEPVAAMMEQLAEAAGAGLLAVMADVYHQGRDSAGDDVVEVRQYGSDVPLRTITLRPTDPDAEHDSAGEPEWNPAARAGEGGFVAPCLCGHKFVDRTPDKAAEFRAEHIAAVNGYQDGQ